MILLVPISPEVPKSHIPRLWPGLVLTLILGVCFLQTYDTLNRDNHFIEGVMSLAQSGVDPELYNERVQSYLSLRPLLEIAPAKGSWDIPRVLMANFVHGSKLHLLLNMVGAFAGARICATFIPFYLSMLIFLIGGSLGIWVSTMLSSDATAFVPHVGASGGIFALMGTYYIFNFRFRTRYFFWFPGKFGKVALPTSWFFFLDVVLLELVLSAAQLMPNSLDNVDHIAHVVGFGVGVLLAVLIRGARRWPKFLQTRAEILHWKFRKRPAPFHPVNTPIQGWLDCLEINPYNDRIKLQLLGVVYKNIDQVKQSDLELTFSYLSPTFIKAHTEVVANCIRRLLKHSRAVPETWLKEAPYDVIIRIAKPLTGRNEDHRFLYQFVDAYRRASPKGGFHHKLELLISRLSGIMRHSDQSQDGKARTASAGNSPRTKTPRSQPRKAKKVS